MLTLTMAGPGAQAPPAPDVSDPRATVWRDQLGAVCAYGQTVDGRHWVHLPGLGAFSFARGDSRVTAVVPASASPELVLDAFRRTVLPLALQALGRQVLHASAVSMGGRVVAFCALSGTGKSTVAGALSRRGHALWADDAVCFDTQGRAVTARGLAFALRLRPESAAFLGADGGGDGAADPPGDRPLAAVIVLERANGGTGVDLQPLAPADAFPAALTHGYCFSIDDPEHKRAMVRSYLDLVERVPVYRLGFPAGLDRLESMLDLIEGAVLGSAPVSP